MTEQPYDQIDSLFTQFRLRLLEVRQSDPEAVEELKSLLSQLEDYISQLVIDSLRLKSLESKAKRAPPGKKGK